MKGLKLNWIYFFNEGRWPPIFPPPAIVVHLVARLNQFFSKCFPRGIPSIFHFIRHQQVSLESRQLLCANDLIQQRTSPFVVVELCQEADDGEACQGGDYRILIPVESENAKKLFFSNQFRPNCHTLILPTSLLRRKSHLVKNT